MFGQRRLYLLFVAGESVTEFFEARLDIIQTYVTVDLHGFGCKTDVCTLHTGEPADTVLNCHRATATVHTRDFDS